MPGGGPRPAGRGPSGQELTTTPTRWPTPCRAEWPSSCPELEWTPAGRQACPQLLRESAGVGSRSGWGPLWARPLWARGGGPESSWWGQRGGVTRSSLLHSTSAGPGGRPEGIWGAGALEGEAPAPRQLTPDSVQARTAAFHTHRASGTPAGVGLATAPIIRSCVYSRVRLSLILRAPSVVWPFAGGGVPSRHHCPGLCSPRGVHVWLREHACVCTGVAVRLGTPKPGWGTSHSALACRSCQPHLLSGGFETTLCPPGSPPGTASPAVGLRPVSRAGGPCGRGRDTTRGGGSRRSLALPAGLAPHHGEAPFIAHPATC